MRNKLLNGVLAFAVAALTMGLDSQDEKASIKSFMEAYKKAYDARDANQLANMWAKDTIYVNLTTHETIQGREAIADYFKDQFETETGIELKVTIDELTFPEPGKAIEKGKAITTMKGQPENTSAFLAELTKADGLWLIQKAFEIDIVPPPSNYEQLKELEWLVGKWGGKNELMDFSLNVTWDENKNFLNEKFALNILGQKDLDIEQIIGWDPAKNQIKSWMFDTDGGFGKGFWRKESDSWHVGMDFTLPDGRKASATHIYTKINDQTFTFASTNRDIEGTMLPDIEPFKISKLQ